MLHEEAWLFSLETSFTFDYSVEMDTRFQAEAVRIALPVQIAVCSRYLPLGVRIDIQDIIDDLEHLPTSFILMDAFNAFNPLWGSVRNVTWS